MDLSPTDAELAFRDDVREFVATAVPPDLKAKVENLLHLEKADYQRWQAILGRRGWATPAWPKEYGGPGWTPLQRIYFEEACFLAGAPRQIPHINMIGPVLQHFGTQAQKDRFLPRVPLLQDWWCQGYSEPSAGSDLASLRTRAVRDGDCYVVTGQKTWTSWAHWADYMFCLVRTSDDGPPQAGISFLLIDMRGPGVTVKPIHSLDEAHDVNEVFLDDVQVPVENLVHEENKGWEVAKYLLECERTEIAGYGQTKRLLKLVKSLAAEAKRGGSPLLDVPAFRERIVRLEMDLLAHEWTLMRAMAATPGENGDPPPSVLKLCGTDLLEQASALLMELGGPKSLSYDPVARRSLANTDLPFGAFLNATTATYLEFRKAGLIGGTTEIQKSIIGKTVRNS